MYLSYRNHTCCACSHQFSVILYMPTNSIWIGLRPYMYINRYAEKRRREMNAIFDGKGNRTLQQSGTSSRLGAGSVGDNLIDDAALLPNDLLDSARYCVAPLPITTSTSNLFVISKY